MEVHYWYTMTTNFVLYGSETCLCISLPRCPNTLPHALSLQSDLIEHQMNKIRVTGVVAESLTLSCYTSPDYLERNPQLLRLETLLSTIYHIDASGAHRCCNSIYLYASVLSPSVSCYTADDHSGNGLTCVSLQLGQLNSSTLR